MHPKKVVLVDDEKLMRLTTSLLLEHHGIVVSTAENGEEGLAVILRELPDVVLLDIMMPGIDGWEVLRRLKADERTRSISIVIFTACDIPVPDDIREQYGTFAILKKPFLIERLLEAVGIKGS